MPFCSHSHPINSISKPHYTKPNCLKQVLSLLSDEGSSFSLAYTTGELNPLVFMLKNISTDGQEPIMLSGTDRSFPTFPRQEEICSEEQYCSWCVGNTTRILHVPCSLLFCASEWGTHIPSPKIVSKITEFNSVTRHRIYVTI